MMNVFGFEGSIKSVDLFMENIQDWSQKHQVCLQVVDANLVFDATHLISAGMHAIRAYHEQRMATNSLAMEVLLYAAGERQITLAIQKCGVTLDTKSIAVICICKEDISEAKGKIQEEEILEFFHDFGFTRNDDVLKGSEETLIQFGLSSEEIQTVSKAKYGQLILEKVARVDILK